jgi:hypothetical protein
MPVSDADDVATGLRTRWASVAVLEALLPASRVYLGTVAEGTAWPYATLTIEEGDIEYLSGPSVLQDFSVLIEAFCWADTAEAGPIRAQLNTAFGGTDSNPSASLTVPGSFGVIYCFCAAGGTVRPSEFRQDGRDAIRVAGTFNIKLEGNRT